MATTPTISIDRIASETILVPIIGTTPLIMHNFSAKGKQQMLDAMQGKKNPKTPKDPQAEYEAAAYRLRDGYGLPAVAFKDAACKASRFYGKDVTMVGLRQFLFVHGESSDRDPQQLVEIFGEPKMREDVVTVGMSGKDLRYRPEFREWSAVLKVTFVSSMLTRGSVLSLIDAAGMGIGVGEWRPEKRGNNGCFTIDETQTIEVVS